MRLIIISIIQVLLLLVFLDPFQSFMLSMMHIVILTAAIIILGVYGVFVERERPVDERDEVHRMLAGRVAFHVGAGLLTVGIAVQSYNHALDPWLVFVLVSMIVAKAGARLYADKER